MSCCPQPQNLCVAAGATFQPIFRWAADTLISKAVTGITNAAPAVVAATGHGVPDGWNVAIVSAGGMTQINSENYPPTLADMKQATFVDSGHVSLNKVNSADWNPYTSGGFLVYYQPIDLGAGVAATLTIYDAPENGVILNTLTSTPAAGITLDNTVKTISVSLNTAGLLWNTGYYRLDIVDNAGKTSQIAYGTILIE